MPEWILPVATTLLGFLIVLKSLPYWLGPALIKATNQVLATPEVTVVRPGSDDMPQAASAYFDRVDASLAKHGLRRLSTVEVRTAPGGLPSYAALYLQPETRILGMAAALTQPRKAFLTYTEFSSELPDGSIYTTNNSPIVSPYKPSPTTETLHFDWIEEPGAVFRVHRGRLAQGRKGAPRLPTPGEELAFIREAIERPVKVQAEYGYFTLDAAAGLYKLTWRGACRLTWLSLSPFKERRAAAMKKRALACMKGLKADKTASRKTA